MCDEWAFYRGDCAPGKPAQATAGLANPATQYCLEKGGQSDIRISPDGGEIGFCVFPDGSECEEWAFYRNECAMGSAYRAMDEAACASLWSAAGEALGKELSAGEAAFLDAQSGGTGSACQGVTSGSGVDFVSVTAAADALRGMFAGKGWEEDTRYAADEGNSTTTAFRRESQLCLVSAGWQPSGDADCPPGEPPSNCNLTAEQQLYTVTISCAQER
jgi:putative hemolysin